MHGKRSKPGGGGGYDLGPSAWSLTFDTETTLDPGQGLRVGAYQLRRRTRLHDEGLFYEPAALTQAEIQTLHIYATAEGLVVRTREEFRRGCLLARRVGSPRADRRTQPAV
jgi:hypothetical protein